MPYFDGTGPMGAGPRTGRGFGSCGLGRFGWGRGFKSWFKPQTKEEVKKDLEQYKKSLEEELAGVNDELKTQ